MKIDERIVKNLAQAADIVNTIGGGSIFPTFNTTKEEDHYRLEVTAPSINPDYIKVEVNGDHLFVFQQIEYKGTRVPNVLGVQKISAGVELQSITAEFEDEVLVVIMPFNELTDGFRREIDIHRN